MAPLGSSDSDGLGALQASVSSTIALIESFHIALRSSLPASASIKSPPQPLALLSDSCKILRAQTTKLSLLILNKPFTPSAIIYILNECSRGCLPAMMSALEFCQVEEYTQLLHNHIRSSLSKIMTELLNLIASIPQDEHGINPQSRSTLASTGVLWAECDKLVTLASDGIVALAAQKAEEFHDLLKDAITELENWDPEDEDSDSDTHSASSTGQEPAPVTDFDTPSPAHRQHNLSFPPILDLRDQSLGVLRTVRLLYPALRKRRISTFTNVTKSTTLESLPSSAMIEKLDAIMNSTQAFSEAADEVTGALYEEDRAQVLRRLGSIQNETEICVAITKTDWRGEEDEFSEWIVKWESRINELTNHRTTMPR